jgi:sporulation protein YlmC with PRC-barrel domain
LRLDPVPVSLDPRVEWQPRYSNIVGMRRCVALPAGTFLHALCFPSFKSQLEETMSLEANETGNLIGSDKVEGTAVYGADSSKIGSIERVMIDKKSGKVSYAVLSFGGFLGIGDDHYPLPWQSLKYDTSLGGYVTGVTEAQLKNAPHYRNDNTWNWSDPTRTRAVNDYYGVAI